MDTSKKGELPVVVYFSEDGAEFQRVFTEAFLTYLKLRLEEKQRP